MTFGGLPGELTHPDATSESLTMLVESLLFVADEPVTAARLAAALGVEVIEVDAALAELGQRLHGRGVRLQQKGDRVQLATMPEAAAAIERFLGLEVSPRLSPAALETLAMVAYRQPITRTQLEAVRGVNCDGVLRTLLSRGLIEEQGRLEAVGRPILYGTTFEFLQYFGLAQLDQLPALPAEAAVELSARVAQVQLSASIADEGADPLADELT
jgi:segregation and condensation protein B